MLSRTARLWLVQSASFCRLAMAVLFATLAFQPVPVGLIGSCYVVAMASDLIDGFLARSFRATTHFGRVLDLVSDKSLTVVSLLYAAARGLPVLPLALIGVREVIVLGMRLIVVEGTYLLPSSRLFGGFMAFGLWGNTLVLVTAPRGWSGMAVVRSIYWLLACLYITNLGARVHRSLPRIRASLTDARGQDGLPPTL